MYTKRHTSIESLKDSLEREWNDLSGVFFYHNFFILKPQLQQCFLTRYRAFFRGSNFRLLVLNPHFFVLKTQFFLLIPQFFIFD